jgi:hypothetical protein
LRAPHRSGRIGARGVRSMSNFPGVGGAASMAAPAFRSDALSGVRSRRIVAFCIDIVIISAVALFVWTALFILTL